MLPARRAKQGRLSVPEIDAHIELPYRDGIFETNIRAPIRPNKLRQGRTRISLHKLGRELREQRIVRTCRSIAEMAIRDRRLAVED
jgi:hypothetical protein